MFQTCQNLSQTSRIIWSQHGRFIKRCYENKHMTKAPKRNKYYLCRFWTSILLGCVCVCSLWGEIAKTQFDLIHFQYLFVILDAILIECARCHFICGIYLLLTVSKCNFIFKWLEIASFPFVKICIWQTCWIYSVLIFFFHY